MSRKKSLVPGLISLSVSVRNNGVFSLQFQHRYNRGGTMSGARAGSCGAGGRRIPTPMPPAKENVHYPYRYRYHTYI